MARLEKITGFVSGLWTIPLSRRWIIKLKKSSVFMLRKRSSGLPIVGLLKQMSTIDP